MSAASTAPTGSAFGLSRPASAVTFSRASTATGRPRSRPATGSVARIRSATVQSMPRSRSAGSVHAAYGGYAIAVPGTTERAGALSSEDAGGADVAGYPHTAATIMRERWPGSRVYDPVTSHGQRARPYTAMERATPDMQGAPLGEAVMPEWAGFGQKAITRTHSAPHVGGRHSGGRKPIPPRAPSASEVRRSQRELSAKAHWFPGGGGQHWYDPPSLTPLKHAPPSLSGMKLGIATVRANLSEIHDRVDSARGKMCEFREDHDFPHMCEELQQTLGPEIAAAREEMTGMFEQMRVETHDLQQQVDVLKHEKNSIAYVLFRMDQKVREIEATMGVRATGV